MSIPPSSSKPTPEQIAHLWRKGNLTYKLHSGQRGIKDKIRALPTTTREVLVFCARRYGKSYLACVLAIEDCLRKPRSNVIFVGPNQKQMLEIIRLILPDIIADAPRGLVRQAKSEKRWLFSNGSQLVIAGFDTAREAVRGLRSDMIYLEESGSSNPDMYEYTLTSILFPTLMHSQGKVIHLTTPSPLIDHPLHTMTIPKTDAAGSFFKFTIQDNPLLTTEIIASEIENMGGMESSHCQRELFCAISRDENITAVPAFNKDRHVRVLNPPEDAHYWVGGDIGGVRDKTAFLLFSYDYNTHQIFVEDERIFPKQTPSKTIVKGALELEGGRELTRAVDAPGQLFIDLSIEYGYSCHLPVKLEFEHNIHRLQVAFFNNEISIHPRCKMLIASLNSGTLNKQRTDFHRSDALGHCDAIAALIYGIRHADKSIPRKKPKRGQDTFNAAPPIEDNIINEMKKLF